MTGPKRGPVLNPTATAGSTACCACRCHEEKTSPVHGYLHSMVEIGLLKILLDHEVLDAIPEGADGIALGELAADVGAEPGLLGRFADFLIASRFLCSPPSSSPSPTSPSPPLQQQKQQQAPDRAERRVAHTALSRSIARDPEARLLFSLAFDFLHVPATEWSEFFDAHGLAEPRATSSSSSSSSPSPHGENGGAKSGGLQTPFALAAGHPRSSPRSILDTMPERAASLRRVLDAAFNSGGGGGDGGSTGPGEAPYDFSWVGEYAASGGRSSSSSRTLVVDVSGDGRALNSILTAEPRIPAAQCVVQDRTGAERQDGTTTTTGKGDPGEVKRMVADILEEQPIKGALLYHLGTALRWCGDAEATRVLGRQRAACATDSRVLAVAEQQQEAKALDAATADIWMLNFGGRARGARELAALAARAGLRVSSVSGGPSSAAAAAAAAGGEVKAGGGGDAGGFAAVVVVEMVPV